MAIDRNSMLVVGLIGLVAGLVLGFVWVAKESRFVVSDLVITPTGCAALRWLGVSVQPLPDTALCTVTAEYSRGGWADRNPIVRVPVGSVVKLVQLRHEDVVSHSERGR